MLWLTAIFIIDNCPSLYLYTHHAPENATENKWIICQNKKVVLAFIPEVA